MKLSDFNLILRAARQYAENLVNRNLLVIYKHRTLKTFQYIEFEFYESNFMHLTGVKFSESSKTSKKSILFYNRCINNELRLEDVSYSKDGTTKLKLDILSDIVSIHTKAKMIGEYNQSRIFLSTEKLLGNVHTCMGVIKNRNNQYYVPNTALKEDIRNLVVEYHQIQATYTKYKNEPKYSKLTMKTKDYKFDEVTNEIKDLISFNH